MAEDDSLPHGIQPVFAAKPGREVLHGGHLVSGGFRQVKIPRQADAHGGHVVAQGVGAHQAGPTPLLDAPVLADEVVIADAGPAQFFPMEPMDRLGGGVPVLGEPGMMDDDLVRGRPLLMIRELEKGTVDQGLFRLPNPCLPQGGQEQGHAQRHHGGISQKVSSIHVLSFPTQKKFFSLFHDSKGRLCLSKKERPLPDKMASSRDIVDFSVRRNFIAFPIHAPALGYVA